MDAQATAKIPLAFEQMPDPRATNRRHNLIDILTIALFAVMAGADGWAAVAQYGRARLAWLRTFLDLPHGIPSHDTLGDVFARLNPQAFERCFQEWMASMVQLSGGKLAAIDALGCQKEIARRSKAKRLAENFSRMCRMGLNLLKNEKSQKTGIAIKRQNCGWDKDYLLKVLLA